MLTLLRRLWAWLNGPDVDANGEEIEHGW